MTEIEIIVEPGNIAINVGTGTEWFHYGGPPATMRDHALRILAACQEAEEKGDETVTVGVREMVWKYSEDVNPAMLQLGMVQRVKKWRLVEGEECYAAIAEHGDFGAETSGTVYCYGTRWQSAAHFPPCESLEQAKRAAEHEVTREFDSQYKPWDRPDDWERRV